MKNSDLFNNPTTLRIFLYLKDKVNSDIGIRETQRALKLKSVTSVTWHLEKLETHGYVTRTPSNRYTLTEKALEIDNFQVPILISTKIIAGNMVPNLIFQLSFLVTMIIVIFSLLFVGVNSLVIISLSLITLFIEVILSIYKWISIDKQLRKYSIK